MKENVFDVLIYLFENYIFDDDGYEPDHDTLALELHQAGFGHAQIDRAFDWLDNLARMCEQNPDEFPAVATSAIRHYSAKERECINLEGQGFLLRLEQSGVLDSNTREMVIGQLMALDIEQIELDQIKWVVFMVVSTFSEDEGIGELTENLILDEHYTGIH